MRSLVFPERSFTISEIYNNVTRIIDNFKLNFKSNLRSDKSFFQQILF